MRDSNIEAIANSQLIAVCNGLDEEFGHIFSFDHKNPVIELDSEQVKALGGHIVPVDQCASTQKLEGQLEDLWGDYVAVGLTSMSLEQFTDKNIGEHFVEIEGHRITRCLDNDRAAILVKCDGEKFVLFLDNLLKKLLPKKVEIIYEAIYEKIGFWR